MIKVSKIFHKFCSQMLQIKLQKMCGYLFAEFIESYNIELYIQCQIYNSKISRARVLRHYLSKIIKS